MISLLGEFRKTIAKQLIINFTKKFNLKNFNNYFKNTLVFLRKVSKQDFRTYFKLSIEVNLYSTCQNSVLFNY